MKKAHTGLIYTTGRGVDEERVCFPMRRFPMHEPYLSKNVGMGFEHERVRLLQTHTGARFSRGVYAALYIQYRGCVPTPCSPPFF